MSKTVSPSTSRQYGVSRVLKAWMISPSTYYDRIKAGPRQRPGPKPKSSDERVIEDIREDLRNSPFMGEGHRKVHARLRRKGIRVGRSRVLRLMRTEKLLSPNRSPSRPVRAHDGRIVTDAPNQRWGTDGTKVWTELDGWIWLFTVVEHWNSECLGFHVTKRGNRFAALEPLTQALCKRLGSAERGIALGLELECRMDNGSQYRADDFRHQLKGWGISASYGLVRQPETNGVAERFNRTLKEQVISGAYFRDVEEVREAVGRFVQAYNQEWLVEKLGYRSPSEAHEAWRLAHAA